MKENEPWLREMMSAALEDKAPGDPNFDKIYTIPNSNRNSVREVPFSHQRRWIIPAAAAVLAAAIATPIGIAAGRISAGKQIQRETTDLFVEGLIGESLFEEDLMMDETWFSEIEVDENFFEI